MQADRDHVTSVGKQQSATDYKLMSAVYSAQAWVNLPLVQADGDQVGKRQWLLEIITLRAVLCSEYAVAVL